MKKKIKPSADDHCGHAPKISKIYSFKSWKSECRNKHLRSHSHHDQRRYASKGSTDRCSRCRATAFTGVCDIVHIGGNLEDGAIEVTVVVVVDQKEVGGTVPRV